MNHEKNREAGRILSKVRDEAVDMVDVGVSHLEVAEKAEEMIREEGGEPAFPLNISIDEEAGHATPSPDDESTFGEEMVNLDIGVHVDGWIADSAVTVDLSGHSEIEEASAEALDAALEIVEAGVSTAEIGSAIEETIEGYGLNPVYNLTGHGLGEYQQHTSPSIPNRAVDQGVELEEDMVVAIEPFATDGSGHVDQGGSTQIYSLNQPGARVRSRRARSLLESIEDSYSTLPFARRWLEGDRVDMNLRRLENKDIVEGYPVLKEDDGKLVSQKEHTVIVQEDGCEVTTK